MLLIADKIENIEISRLFTVYSETISSMKQEYGAFRGEYAFIISLQEFLSSENAYLGIWCVDGIYMSAVRLEPYRDGYILSCLESAPEHRNCGAAKAIITEMINFANDRGFLPLYSHIHKSNLASIKAFTHCGFEITGKPAVFLDGSVYASYHTLYYKKATDQ